MELVYYVCVTGSHILLPEGVDHTVSVIADADTPLRATWESLISCPITQEYFREPVLLTATGNTYERAAIIQWLSEHDNDPLSGVHLADTNIVPNAALVALMYRLEARDGALLYHDLECEPLLAQFQAIYQQLGHASDRERVYEEANTYAITRDRFNVLINDGIPCVDVSVYYVAAKHIHSTLSEAAVKAVFIARERNIQLALPTCAGVLGVPAIARPKYALSGIMGLLRCPVSGRPLLRAVVTNDGISYDANVVAAERCLNKNHSHTYDKLRARELICAGNAVNNNVIRQICAEVFVRDAVDPFVEVVTESVSVNAISEPDDEPMIMALCADCLSLDRECDRIRCLIRISEHDMCQQCLALWIHRTYLKRELDNHVYVYWTRLQLYKNVCNQNVNIRYMRPRDNALESMWRKVERMRSIANQMSYELVILNKFARAFLIRQGNTFYHSNNELTHKRRQLRLPHMDEGNTYGTDLSFLDLSNMRFKRTSFKDFVFCGTNLYGVRFDKCDFSCCNFAGATLTACVFNKCKFRECELSYKTVGNATYIKKKEF